jgi:hypothetical protein
VYLWDRICCYLWYDICMNVRLWDACTSCGYVICMLIVCIVWSNYLYARQWANLTYIMCISYVKDLNPEKRLCDPMAHILINLEIYKEQGSNLLYEANDSLAVGFWKRRWMGLSGSHVCHVATPLSDLFRKMLARSILASLLFWWLCEPVLRANNLRIDV